MNSELGHKDSQYIWHPYTQMLHGPPLIPMLRGWGAYLYDEQDNEYIDAISSWWTNLHGHAHPYIAAKIYEQASTLEQVIFAGFTHEPAIKLAEKLLERIPYHSKIFYSDNGSTAVEVAIKMSLQYWWNKDQERRKIIAFKDSYHGDTFGAMSVSARGLFTRPYQSLLFDIEFIDTPLAGKEKDTIEQLKRLLNNAGDSNIAGFIYEPLVLGSSGMLMYSETVLDELLAICKDHQIITIADEVMTGFGRTGKFMASEYCVNKPDIICLSKGITGGFMPFAATTCRQEIFDAFLSQNKEKMFFHGHSYTANPLGCVAAIASLELFETENTFGGIADIAAQHLRFAVAIQEHQGVKEVRCRGTILALELETPEGGGYLNNIRDKAYAFFIERKVILRPLGNILYILPPYCIAEEDLNKVYRAMKDFLDAI